MISSETQALLTIGVGILLLASPAIVFAADIGETPPGWEIEAIELDPQSEGLGIPPEYKGNLPDMHDNIVCLHETRSCKLERYVNEQGQLAVTNISNEGTSYEFVYLDGSFYETVERTENGSAVLSHKPVSGELALRNSSFAYESAPPEYRDAVDNGYATTRFIYEMPSLVTVDPHGPNERFYYIVPRAIPPWKAYGLSLGERLLMYGLSITAFVVGLVLVLHGHRKRIHSNSE